MTDKRDGIDVLADLLGDVAKIDPGLIWRLIVLMVAIIWVIAGWYSVLWPDKMLAIRRRHSTKQVWDLWNRVGLNSQMAIKVMGYAALVLGIVVLAVDVYLFAHPTLLP